MANEVKIVASIDVAKSQAKMQKQLNEMSKSLNMTIKAQADMGKSIQNTNTSIEKMSKDFKTAQANASSLANVAPKIDKINTPLKEASKNAYSFGNMLGEGVKKMAVWSLAATAFYAPIRALQSNIKYTLELDDAMNQIRIVTYKTQDEVNTLALSYNKLAKEMGTTTTEIANTSVELYRQGLATSEVEERMNSIIKYAKISSISLEKSNEIITATANATGEKVGKIVDIFALLGDSTASGADEIGEALQKLASTAENSGMSIEKSASYIATISSVTRESASVIGNSIKSIISRYESIKAKGFNEEDATQINDVTKALTSIGIAAVDSEGQLRPFADVMDDLGGKYKNLTKNEQAYITTTLGGKQICLPAQRCA